MTQNMSGYNRRKFGARTTGWTTTPVRFAKRDRIAALRQMLKEDFVPHEEKVRYMEETLRAAERSIQKREPKLTQEQIRKKAEEWLRDKLV